MEYTPLNIKDVVLMTPKVFRDDRGFFLESYRADDFNRNVTESVFVQDNHSGSVRGTLRGLHYQVRRPQGKLVRVTLGTVFDVAVDLRRSSPDFGRWAGAVLSSENNAMLWIPPGFAHGFYVMSDRAEFSYKCTDYYAPQYERSLLWNDPDIDIEWPLVPGTEILLSEKDRQGVGLRMAEVFS